MKAVSNQMLALLETEQFYSADLFKIDLAGGGGTLLYSAGDKDIIAQGVRYPATGVFGSNSGSGGPYFNTEGSKFKLHQKIGIQVDSFTFDVLPGNAKVLGAPFLTACRQGQFDGAIVSIERAYMPTYGDTSAGTITIFIGRVGLIDIGRSVATFTVNSYLELLNIELPKNVYQAGCVNQLGDSTCQVVVAAYGQTLTDAGGGTVNQVNCNISNPLAGYFDQGRITFQTGALKGVTRTIHQVVYGAPGFILLVGVLPIPSNGGDTFIVTPGCDKSVTSPNGCPKFANQTRFRGFPEIPNPTTAI